MILAIEEFNILYLIVVVSALLIATLITCIKIFGRDRKINKINEELKQDIKVLDDETSILKKK
jgi:hypothetical protein